MKCADCDGGLMPRPQLRLQAIRLAAAIASGEQLSPPHRASFACYGLLLVGELGTRCEVCAHARVMAGVEELAGRAAQ